MGEDSDPYDFTEDENSQRFKEHSFTTSHIFIVWTFYLIFFFFLTIAQPSQQARPASQRSSQRKKTDISQDRFFFSF